MSQNQQEQSEAKLLDFIEGELDEAGRIEIEKHLEANPHHRRMLDELSRTRDLVRYLPRESAPPELLEQIQQQLERSVLLDDHTAAPTDTLKINRWPQFRMAAAIALLASGLGVAVYFSLPPLNRPYAVNQSPLAAPTQNDESNADRKDVRKGNGEDGVAPAGKLAATGPSAPEPMSAKPTLAAVTPTPGTPDPTPAIAPAAGPTTREAIAKGPDRPLDVGGVGAGGVGGPSIASAVLDELAKRSNKAAALARLQEAEKIVMADAAKSITSLPDVQKALLDRSALTPGIAAAPVAAKAMREAAKPSSTEPLVLVVSAADPSAAELQIDTFLTGLSVPVDHVGKGAAGRQLETETIAQMNRLREPAAPQTQPGLLKPMMKRADGAGAVMADAVDGTGRGARTMQSNAAGARPEADRAIEKQAGSLEQATQSAGPATRKAARGTQLMIARQLTRSQVDALKAIVDRPADAQFAGIFPADADALRKFKAADKAPAEASAGGAAAASPTPIAPMTPAPGAPTTSVPTPAGLGQGGGAVARDDQRSEIHKSAATREGGDGARRGGDPEQRKADEAKAAPGAVQVNGAAAVTKAPAFINPGDTIQITSTPPGGGVPTVRQLKVAANGTVVVPGLGAFRCAGLTPREAGDALTKELRVRTDIGRGVAARVELMEDAPTVAAVPKLAAGAPAKPAAVPPRPAPSPTPPPAPMPSATPPPAAAPAPAPAAEPPAGVKAEGSLAGEPGALQRPVPAATPASDADLVDVLLIVRPTATALPADVVPTAPSTQPTSR